MPDHLDVPIREWLYEVLRKYDMATPVAVRLKLPSKILKSRDPYAELATLDDRMNPMLRLEIIDATLGCVQQALQGADWHSQQMAASYARQLAGILREGDSAFTVSEDGGKLEHRIDETLHATYDKAVDAGAAKAAAAAGHLRAAFTEAYGIRPDPSAAYSRAVKAVEAVANPQFLPNAPEPTLGKVRDHLDQGRHKYEMVIADRAGAPAGIEAVVAMISLLWRGQRDRHEGGPTSAPVTQEAAETAVHTAAILVHWISTGSIRRK
ncbi:hypothetical protein [Streptomyces rubiginosohelvolus]|uniref:hypothetical protein n=1 Tax=Streptomyces rubiginosohelvolus TaxID=67362 RepID=UPI00369A7AC3